MNASIASVPHTPMIKVQLSLVTVAANQKSLQTTAVYQKSRKASPSDQLSEVEVAATAGIDTYSTHSFLPMSVVESLGCPMIIPPENGNGQIHFLDGTTTGVLGYVMIAVRHESVIDTILVRFLVVHTINAALNIDILLGLDYIRERGRLTLEFGPTGINTIFCAAMIHAGRVVEDDFTLERAKEGHWTLSWKWINEPSSVLFKGVFLYESRIRKTKYREGFFNEVDKWVKKGFIIPYDENRYGATKGYLTWNPVVAPHKSTPVRPALDFTLLNAYVLCKQAISEAEICTVSIRQWRRLKIARLIDVEKAFMHIHLHEKFFRHTVVKYRNQFYCLTRLGFGLSIGCRVLKSLLQHIFSAENIVDCLHFRDDIVCGKPTDSAQDVKEVEAKTVRIRDVLAQHGLPTKEPVDLYDCESEPTRALGLDLRRIEGDIRWSRRADSDLSLPHQWTFREIAGLVGRICPGHLPVLGSMRPAGLVILSQTGKLVHKSNWNSRAPESLIAMATDLAKMATESDEACGRWLIPSTNNWCLATDASSTCMSACIMSLEDWQKTPHAACPVLEDHAWLNKSSTLHINVLELDALVKGFRCLLKLISPGDTVLLVNDNKAVVSWINKSLRDEKINIVGLYAVLVERRLDILKETMQGTKVRIEWLETTKNPADKLTRAPHHWVIESSPMVISCAIGVTIANRIRDAQEADPSCREKIRELDRHAQISIVDGIAYSQNTEGHLRMLLPESMASEVILENHQKLGHAGWQATWVDLKKHYVACFTDLARRTQQCISECPNCCFKVAKPTKGNDEHSVRVFPWYECFIDTCQISTAGMG